MTITDGPTITDAHRLRIVWLSIGAIAGQVLFTIGWLIGGVLQDPPFSPARHDISDQGALTAQHAWLMLVTQGVSGVLTIAFALGALRPALAIPGRREAVGPWLLALSLPAIDNVSDAFFRLDCRASDPGCAEATMSWHAQVHGIVGTVAAFITFAAPFVLLRRLRQAPGWRPLWWPTLITGIAFVVALNVYAFLGGRDGSGIAQRALAVIACTWIVLLAVHVIRLNPPIGPDGRAAERLIEKAV